MWAGEKVPLCGEERGLSTWYLQRSEGQWEGPQPGVGEGAGPALLKSWRRKPEQVTTPRNDAYSPHQAGSGRAERREHLEWEAGRLLQAAGLTVEASDEGDPGSRLGGEVQIVINQLAPLHEQQRAVLVRGQLLIGEAHDGVGDSPSLGDTDRQGTPRAAPPRASLALSVGQGSPGAPGSRHASPRASSRRAVRSRLRTPPATNVQRRGWKPPAWVCVCEVRTGR